MFTAVKVSDRIWWVGAIDWNLRNFHGFITPRGSTYNAYLVFDEKIALIDTVKAPFAKELLERISSRVDPSRIDYVITNHVEMDHAGSLDVIRSTATNAKFITNKRAAEDLNRHFKKNWAFEIVKTGSSISLGKTSLQFIETPMVHWPDSMMTYCKEEHTLFPNDGFGQHLASHDRFDDDGPAWDDLRSETAKYYANIMLPFAAPVKKALDAISTLDINVIAPSHGIIWRRNTKQIINCYNDWAANKTERKAVVVYDTMWNSTELMAKAIAEGLKASGVNTCFFNLRNTDTSEIMKEILEAKAIIVGSPTLNNGLLPTVCAFLTYLKGLKPKGRVGFAFGSHGWGGGGTQAIEAELKAAGIEIIRPAINYRYIPDDNELNDCFAAAKETAKNI